METTLFIHEQCSMTGSARENISFVQYVFVWKSKESKISKNDKIL